jgi:hypothetical protein
MERLVVEVIVQSALSSDRPAARAGFGRSGDGLFLRRPKADGIGPHYRNGGLLRRAHRELVGPLHLLGTSEFFGSGTLRTVRIQLDFEPKEVCLSDPPER